MPYNTTSILQNQDNITHGRGELTTPQACGHHCDPTWCPGCGDEYEAQRERQRAECAAKANTCACTTLICMCPDWFEDFYG
jgi:hypothetical protein